MDVCFSNYGHCNYVSAKHASIFYDEVNHFFSSKFVYLMVCDIVLIKYNNWKCICLKIHNYICLNNKINKSFPKD